MGKKSVRSYLHGQVRGIYHKVGKGIGESRHELKQEGIKSEKITATAPARLILIGSIPLSSMHAIISGSRTYSS